MYKILFLLFISLFFVSCGEKNNAFRYFEKDDMIDNPYYHPFSKYVYSQKNIPLLEKFSTFYE